MTRLWSICVVVHGIAGAGDLKKVGRVGVKALVYFEVMTIIALALGVMLTYVFGPGHGMNIDPSKLDASAMSNYSANVHKLQGSGVGALAFASTSSRRRRSMRWRATTCCRSCSSRSSSARRWRWSVTRAGRSRR